MSDAAIDLWITKAMCVISAISAIGVIAGVVVFLYSFTQHLLA